MGNVSGCGRGQWEDAVGGEQWVGVGGEGVVCVWGGGLKYVAQLLNGYNVKISSTEFVTNFRSNHFMLATAETMSCANTYKLPLSYPQKSLYYQMNSISIHPPITQQITPLIEAVSKSTASNAPQPSNIPFHIAFQ